MYVERGVVYVVQSFYRLGVRFLEDGFGVLGCYIVFFNNQKMVLIFYKEFDGKVEKFTFMKLEVMQLKIKNSKFQRVNKL